MVYLNVGLLTHLAPYFDNALTIIQETATKAAQEEIPNLNALLQSNQMFMNNFKVILLGSIAFVLIMLVVWVATQTINWWLVTKKKWWKVLLTSLASYAVLLVVVMTAASLYSNSISVLPVMSSVSAVVLSSLLLLSWHYGFTLLHVKGGKPTKLFTMVWLVTVLAKGILFMDLLWLLRWPSLGIVFGLLVFLPSFSLSRWLAYLYR